MLNHFHTTTAATCAPHPSIQAATVIVSLPLKKRIPPFEIAILCTNHGSRNYLLIYFSISNMIILGMLYKAKCDDILGLLEEYELVLYFRKRTAKYDYSFSR